jgi:hypothetical protein
MDYHPLFVYPFWTSRTPNAPFSYRILDRLSLVVEVFGFWFFQFFFNQCNQTNMSNINACFFALLATLS